MTSIVDIATGQLELPAADDREGRIFQKAWEISPTVIVVTDAAGNIEYVNPAFERATGYSAAEVLGKNPKVLKSGAQGPDVYADLWRTISSGGTWFGRMQNRRKDGSLYWESATIAPIRDRRGAILHYIAVKENITEEVLASERAVRAVEQTELLAEQSGTVYWTVDAEGTCTDVSPSARKVWGYRPDQIIGRPFYELHPESVRKESRLQAYEIFHKKEPFVNFLHQLTRADGNIIWVVTNGLPVLDADGRLVGYSGTDTDVTALKDAERAIADNEEKFRAIANYTVDWETWFSPDGKMLWVNPAVERVTGYSAEEMLGMEDFISVLVAEEDRESCSAKFQEALGGSSGNKFEFRFLHKNGSKRWLDTSWQPIFDTKGNPLGIRTSGREITDRKQVEQALRESEERFRLMLQHIPAISVQGYYMDGTTHYWNDASELLYGYSAIEAIGRNLLDLIIPAEMREGVRQAITTMARTLQPHPASEMTLVRKDGSRVTVFSSHAIVRRHRGEPELFCIDIDLTDRKRAEESLRELNIHLQEATARAEALADKAESATRAKSEFLAVMSHELRTPLNGVLGFADLLGTTPLDDEQRDYAETIKVSGSHLLEIVNDILDFSSIEKGLTTIESKPVAISDVVESACAPTRKSAIDKGLQFLCETAPGTPAFICGDVRRIRQILINLLSNSIKFTTRGSVVLRVGPGLDAGGQTVDFSVEDTGQGIPAEKLNILFKPFSQADTSLHRRFEGTGLGLAISHRLAEAMGGTITCLSTPGRGSTFTLRLPLENRASETPPTAARSETPELLAVAAISAPVLVVEDDDVSSSLAGKMLAALGLRAEFAANGLEAIEAFGKGKFAAILMDIQMPLMDGIEATKRIRGIEQKSGGHVPVIALTANVMPNHRERCREAGMDDFLSKPFKRDQLAAKLAAAISLEGK